MLLIEGSIMLKAAFTYRFFSNWHEINPYRISLILPCDDDTGVPSLDHDLSVQFFNFLSGLIATHCPYFPLAELGHTGLDTGGLADHLVGVSVAVPADQMLRPEAEETEIARLPKVHPGVLRYRVLCGDWVGTVWE